ncbi:MAG: endonuclease [Bacteroidetes bacterium]|nr:endonuclease [Bacteroidota bacterium]
MNHKIFALIPLAALAFSGCKTDDVEPINAGKVALSADPVTISEDGGSSVLTATLGSVMEEDVVVMLAFSGDAESGKDFNADAQITIPKGQISSKITLTAVQDTIKEGNETIQVDMQSVTGAEEDGVQKVEIVIEDDDVPAQFNMVINEVLYDPSNNGLDGDANGDGSYSQAEDEFVEFVNLSSQAIDLSGYKIFDTENSLTGTPNHLVPNGTIIQPGKAFVVFGGGTPTGTFGGATVQTSTSGDLNLNNAGDELLFVSAAGDTLLRFNIEPLSNNPNESYTRYPDITGDFEQHSAHSTKLFSPGTKVDGTAF